MKNLFNTKFGGISLLNPLPPLGSYFSCEVVPLSISPDFIMCSNIHNFTMSLYDVNCLYLIKVDNVSAVTSSENRLLINGQIVCCIDNTCLLNSLVSLISSIAQLPLEEREVKIKTFWQMRMDLNTASETILNANSIQSRLRIYCNFLFVLITIAVPLIYLFQGTLIFMVSIFVIIMALNIVVIYRFFIAHKSIFIADKFERIASLFKMIFCPPVSVRACDLLTENSLRDIDSIAIGAILLSKVRRSPFIDSFIRHYSYDPYIDNFDEDLRRLIVWQNRLLIEIALLKKIITRDDILRALMPPARLSNSCSIYCPRCLLQLTKEDSICPDCRDVVMMRFDEILIEYRGEQHD